MSEHKDRLQAMTEDKGDTWDLSPNDVAAIQWALDSLEAALAELDALKAGAVEAWGLSPEKEDVFRWVKIAPDGAMVLGSIQQDRMQLATHEIYGGFRVALLRVTVLPEEDAR